MVARGGLGRQSDLWAQPIVLDAVCDRRLSSALRVHRGHFEVPAGRRQVFDDVPREARVVQHDDLRQVVRIPAVVDPVSGEIGQRASIRILGRRVPGQRGGSGRDLVDGDVERRERCGSLAIRNRDGDVREIADVVGTGRTPEATGGPVELGPGRLARDREFERVAFRVARSRPELVKLAFENVRGGSARDRRRVVLLAAIPGPPPSPGPPPLPKLRLCRWTRQNSRTGGVLCPVPRSSIEFSPACLSLLLAKGQVAIGQVGTVQPP